MSHGQVRLRIEVLGYCFGISLEQNIEDRRILYLSTCHICHELIEEVPSVNI